jgi:hypothetical protein
MVLSPVGAGTVSVVTPVGIADCSREGLFQGLARLLRSFSPVGEVLAQEIEAPAVNEVTPGQVLQPVSDMISEIQLLRDAEGVADYPPEAEHQEDRLPIHAYVKSLEVMKKVSRLQRRLEISPDQTEGIPVRPVLPKDVLGHVRQVVDELRKVKTQLAISDEIEPAPLEGRTDFSTVYKGLGDASFLLDGLVGYPLSPSDVYANVLEIQDDLELIAAKLGANLTLDPPGVDGKKSAGTVAQQVLRATYKVIGFQARLGMNESSMPSLTLVRVTPSEVFESTSTILAELARIKTHLDISLPRLPRPEPRIRTLEEVFAQVLLVIENLDVLTEAALHGQGRPPRPGRPRAQRRRTSMLGGRSRPAAGHPSPSARGWRCSRL